MATLRNVAERAGVSPATASLVLNGRGAELGISEDCARRVRRAAKELAYRGNYHARTLSVGRAFTLGLAIGTGPDAGLSHRLWSAIATGVDAAARENANDLLIVGPRAGQTVFERGVQCLTDKRIDALIAVGALYSAVPESVLQLDLPVVLVETDEPGRHPAVNLDAAPGIHEAVQHLAELGHRDVLWIGRQVCGEIRLPERTAAFRDAVRSVGIVGRELFVNEEGAYLSSFEGSIVRDRAALAPLFPLPKESTAVICFNEQMALGLYSLLSERGRRVPTDLSIVGFDDLHASRAFPAMTTISHVLPEMGRRAVEVALAMVEAGPSRESRRGTVELVASKLVVRDSTAAAPGGATWESTWART